MSSAAPSPYLTNLNSPQRLRQFAILADPTPAPRQPAEPYWPITYQTPVASGDTVLENMAIAQHPADWLLEAMAEFNDLATILLFAMPISAEQYNQFAAADDKL